MSNSQETFLIIDDEPVTLQLITAFIEAARPVALLKAQTMKEALSLLLERGPEIQAVICDHDLGDGTGVKILGAIRSGGLANVARALPFIMLTAHGEEQIIKTALSFDVHAYLMKPVSQKQLMHSLDKSLTRDITLKDPDSYKAKLDDL